MKHTPLLRHIAIVAISFLFSISLYAQPDADKPVTTKDQVFLDDLIVDGSTCVGQDCSNGESFGFDTVRLKENNLRIKFDDTSATASFPSNDWQLTANDSSNGGQNKFSIDDVTGGKTPFTVLAGAPSHSLFVDASGRLGLGTSTPVTDIHVKSGNTPTLRLDQDGSDGFTPQTWDVAGNETNFFVRDASNGSTLPFRIRPSAPSNSIYIDYDGDVGLGTTSPSVKLHVMGSGIFTGELEAASDQKLKKNVLPLLNASAILNVLNVVTYDMNIAQYESLNLPEGKQYGLLAQEVENYIPELVSTNLPDPNGDEKLKTINYIQLIPFLIKANQEQEALIIQQNTEILNLQKRLNQIEEMLRDN